MLCPGYNDGEELERSLSDLASLAPYVQSASVVPVGLTAHRDGLSRLMPFDKGGAQKVLETVAKYGKRTLKEYGTRTFYAADEFYLLAEKPIPSRSHYEEFYQIENGVGMWRVFYDRHRRRKGKINGGYDVATGVLAYPLICEVSGFANEKIHVHEVKNDFFGHSITVAGLLTGQDLVKQLKNNIKTDTLLLPSDMFRNENDLTLDDMTAKDLEQALGVEVLVVEKLI